MKLSFEVSYFDPSGKIRFSAVREGWAEENGTWRNPELGLAFAFRLDPERRSYVRRTEKLKRDTAVIKRMTDDIAALDSTQKAFLDDFFLQGGILSISISFVPLLLFNVVVSGYRFVENIYKNLSNWFGYHDDTFSAVSSFTDEMRQKQQQRGI